LSSRLDKEKASNSLADFELFCAIRDGLCTRES
jgi:hypothetical protein